jgi:cytochrome o ubiquinol oxidase operon protein cyoD
LLEHARPIAHKRQSTGVLAFAQIGVHLVLFLHLGSGPDSTNNILALAFGVLIVFLVITGSVWIIANLNSNTMPMPTQ